MKSRRLGGDPQLQKVEAAGLLLANGSHGTGVAQVQDLLVSLGFKMPKSMKAKGADGLFGPETQATLKDFQRQHQLNPDGIVGPKTLAKLDELVVDNPALESPDPLREAAVNRFDAGAPLNLKRSVYT